MSEYNPIVINWTGRAKPAGLSFLIVNLGVPWTIPLNQCSRGIALNVCCSSSLEGNCHSPLRKKYTAYVYFDRTAQRCFEKISYWRNQVNTRFIVIFLPLRLPMCRKRHRSRYSEYKANDAESAEFYKSISTSAIFLCYWSWSKMYCSAILQIIEHIRLSLTADQLVEYT